jgi:hypothetical protein
VMPGVRSPERNSLMARDAHAVPLGRSNKRLNATAHSAALMYVVSGGALSAALGCSCC